jgi:hypothetical protein
MGMPDRNSDTGTVEREEGKSELTAHLVTITSRASLPAILGRAASGVDSWDGLGLISGSTAKDIITVLTAFINQYDRANWMRVEFPGVTDDEIQWLLSTMTEAVGQPVSPGGTTRRGSSKSTRARTTQAGLGVHRDKRGRADSWSKSNRARSRSASPPRRSTRHRTEPERTTNNEQQTSGPPGLDRQTSTHRRQLSRAFRELYGTPAQGHGALWHNLRSHSARAICVHTRGTIWN